MGSRTFVPAARAYDSRSCAYDQFLWSHRAVVLSDFMRIRYIMETRVRASDVSAMANPPAQRVYVNLSTRRQMY